MFFEYPQKYIERDVTVGEFVGTWQITDDSEMRLDEFLEKFPGWGSYAPWKTITLNEDFSCNAQFEDVWVRHDAFRNSSITSCAWEITEERSVDGEDVPSIRLELTLPENRTSSYSLYIHEENNELILWEFIGDPDDFSTQDYTKVSH